jgi:hypothetical protein
MANKKFTEEEMNRLRASRYVLQISRSIVHFSAEFKALFWNSLQAGKEPRDAVIELGIDPDILGEHRVVGLKGMVRNEIKDGKGFRDLETYGRYLNDTTDSEARIRNLEQQLAYKDQEIEFLKKIVSLGRGAKGA